MNLLNNDNIKQLGLLSLIVILGLTLITQLSTFIPGVLAAVTMYILLRNYFFYLIHKRKWKKWIAAMVLIIASIVVFVLPLFFLFQAIIPKFSNLLSQTGQLNDIINALTVQIREMNIPVTISSEQVVSLLENISSSVPAVLGATINFLTNTIMAFFILYFMFVQGEEMEETIMDYLPFQKSNNDEIWEATRVMVYSNAIGIPILAASQAIVAMLGYYIFKVDAFFLWGILTGLFSVVPILGCIVVWAPLCIYLAVSGNTSEALGLAVYSLILTGGVDNVLRFTILKRLGDIHPITTTFGIIVGVPLFGIMGFIFGPLLFSYFLLMIRVYRAEFSPQYKLKKRKDQ